MFSLALLPSQRKFSNVDMVMVVVVMMMMMIMIMMMMKSFFKHGDSVPYPLIIP